MVTRKMRKRTAVECMRLELQQKQKQILTEKMINAQRFGLDTPCCKTGSCFDCKNPDTICCQFLVTRYSKHPNRIKVILVNEDLGF